MKLELGILCTFIVAVLGLKKFTPEDCEVCMGTINKFRETLTSDIKTAQQIQEHFKKFCAKVKNSKEDRFCFYVGGKEDSAASILGILSKPLESSFPTDAVCKKLFQADSQICELRYEKVIDLKTVDLNKLKVRDLKKIINDWNEDCKGCLEKTDYIKRIRELEPAHTEL